MDDAQKKARELMEYCSGAKWEDGVTHIAAVLREKDAEIARQIAKLKAELEAVRATLKAVIADRDGYMNLLHATNRERDEARQAAEQAAERQRELAEKVVEASRNGSKNFYAAVELANAILAQAEGNKKGQENPRDVGGF